MLLTNPQMRPIETSRKFEITHLMLVVGREGVVICGAHRMMISLGRRSDQRVMHTSMVMIIVRCGRCHLVVVMVVGAKVPALHHMTSVAQQPRRVRRGREQAAIVGVHKEVSRIH